MFRRFPIRRKLVAALAVPLVALLVVAVFEAIKTSREAGDIEHQADLATAALGPGSLPSLLENERNAAALYLLDMEELVNALAVPPLNEAEPATDDALEDLRSMVENGREEVRVAYGPVLENFAGLSDLRERVSTYSGTRGLQNIEFTVQIFDGYSNLMEQLFDAARQVALEVDNSELRTGGQLLELAARQADLHAKLAARAALAEMGGDADHVNQPSEISLMAGLLAELDENAKSIRTKGTGDYQPMVDELFATDHIQEFRDMVDGILKSPTGAVDVISMFELAGGPEGTPFGYTVFREAVDDHLTDRADSLVSDAQFRSILYWVLAGAIVLLAMFATWLVSRSITRPLRSLTRQATDMANHRLPDAVLDILDTPLGDDVTVPAVEPISVHTRDEVSDVAGALNTVQDSALDLAVEQAVLRRNIADSFVNLGRRNQNLLGRQLDFITELEHNETDSDTLGNLFRLDHLATRMRRNAESLLVLAGIDPPRKWAAPVRITDAIRAALGEVEDYQRVTVRNVEPSTILGSAAADLAHLLAELIENALIFSPPDQTVEIRGRNQPTGYTLAIVDAGLGMSYDELNRANRRLAGAESFTIAPSKYLGHYVAGNLAARHTINVQLHNSPGHGITATINLPPTLITSEGPMADPDVAAPDLAPPPPPPPPPGMSAEPAVAAAPPGQVLTADAAPPAFEQPPFEQPTYEPATYEQPSYEQPGFESPLPAAASDISLDPLPPATDPGLPPLSSPHLRVTPSHSPPPVRPPTGPTPVVRPPTGPTPPVGGSDPERTAGGLVKRPPRRTAEGDLAGPPPPSPHPSEDLLQTLATYTTHLHRQIDANRPPAQQQPPQPEASPPPPPMPPRQQPAAAPPTPGTFPPFNPTPPPGTPMVRPDLPPIHTGPNVPVTPRPDHTTSGLARRVRGAQLPKTQPVSLRRTGEVPVVGGGRQPGRLNLPNNEHHRGTPDDAGRARRVSSSDANAKERSAKDVYSFLSSFSAGVQRGLDESRRNPTTSEEDQ